MQITNFAVKIFNFLMRRRIENAFKKTFSLEFKILIFTKNQIRDNGIFAIKSVCIKKFLLKNAFNFQK